MTDMATAIRIVFSAEGAEKVSSNIDAIKTATEKTATTIDQLQKSLNRVGTTGAAGLKKTADAMLAFDKELLRSAGISQKYTDALIQMGKAHGVSDQQFQRWIPNLKKAEEHIRAKSMAMTAAGRNGKAYYDVMDRVVVMEKMASGQLGATSKAFRQAKPTIDMVTESHKQATTAVGKHSSGLKNLIPHVALVTLSYMAMRRAVRAVTETLATGAEFEHTMSIVGGIARATASEFEMLAKAARKAGEETLWTATEAANALRYLAMAGFKAEEAIAALPGVLNLALIGEMDLARATDIITDVLMAFRLSADQSGRVVDVFTGTITRSNTNIEAMGQAMKFVAPVAASLGYTIEDVSAMIGVLSQSGIKAGIAGRALRMSLLRSGDAAKELGISSANLIDILKELNARQLAPTELADTLHKLFGIEAVPSMITLMQNIDQLKEFIETLHNVGGETDAFIKRLDTTKVAWGELKSVIEDVAIEGFMQYSDSIKQALKDLKEYINSHKKDIIDFAGAITNLAGVVLNLLIPPFESFMKLITTLNEIVPIFTKKVNDAANELANLPVIGTTLTESSKGWGYIIEYFTKILPKAAANVPDILKGKKDFWSGEVKENLDEYTVSVLNLYAAQKKAAEEAGRLALATRENAGNWEEAENWVTRGTLALKAYQNVMSEIKDMKWYELLPESEQQTDEIKKMKAIAEFQEKLIKDLKDTWGTAFDAEAKNFKELIEIKTKEFGQFYDNVVKAQKAVEASIDPMGQMVNQHERLEQALPKAAEEELAFRESVVKAQNAVEASIDPMSQMVNQHAQLEKALQKAAEEELAFRESVVKARDEAQASIDPMGQMVNQHERLEQALKKVNEELLEFNTQIKKLQDEAQASIDPMGQMVNQHERLEKALKEAGDKQYDDRIQHQKDLVQHAYAGWEALYEIQDESLRKRLLMEAGYAAEAYKKRLEASEIFAGDEKEIIKRTNEFYIKDLQNRVKEQNEINKEFEQATKKLWKTDLDIAIDALDKEVAKFREAKKDEAIIEEYYQTMRKKIIKDYWKDHDTQIANELADNEKYYKEVTNVDKKYRNDKLQAMKSLYEDLGKISGEYYTAEVELIKLQAEKYLEMLQLIDKNGPIKPIAEWTDEDKALFQGVIDWVTFKIKELNIKALQQTGNFIDGVKSYLLQAQLDWEYYYQKVSQIGYDEMKALSDGTKEMLSSALKLDFDEVKSAWENMLDKMLDLFTDFIANLMVTWLASEIANGLGITFNMSGTAGGGNALSQLLGGGSSGSGLFGSLLSIGSSGVSLYNGLTSGTGLLGTIGSGIGSLFGTGVNSMFITAAQAAEIGALTGGSLTTGMSTGLAGMTTAASSTIIGIIAAAFMAAASWGGDQIMNSRSDPSSLTIGARVTPSKKEDELFNIPDLASSFLSNGEWDSEDIKNASEGMAKQFFEGLSAYEQVFQWVGDESKGKLKDFVKGLDLENIVWQITQEASEGAPRSAWVWRSAEDQFSDTEWSDMTAGIETYFKKFMGSGANDVLAQTFVDAWGAADFREKLTAAIEDNGEITSDVFADIIGMSVSDLETLFTGYANSMASGSEGLELFMDKINEIFEGGADTLSSGKDIWGALNDLFGGEFQKYMQEAVDNIKASDMFQYMSDEFQAAFENIDMDNFEEWIKVFGENAAKLSKAASIWKTLQNLGEGFEYSKTDQLAAMANAYSEAYKTITEAYTGEEMDEDALAAIVKKYYDALLDGSENLDRAVMGITDLDVAVGALDGTFDAYIAQMKELGVDVEKLTELEGLRQKAMAKLLEDYKHQLGLIGDEEYYTARMEKIMDQYKGYFSSADDMIAWFTTASLEDIQALADSLGIDWNDIANDVGWLMEALEALGGTFDEWKAKLLGTTDEFTKSTIAERYGLSTAGMTEDWWKNILNSIKGMSEDEFKAWADKLGVSASQLRSDLDALNAIFGDLGDAATATADDVREAIKDLQTTIAGWTGSATQTSSAYSIQIEAVLAKDLKDLTMGDLLDTVDIMGQWAEARKDEIDAEIDAAKKNAKILFDGEEYTMAQLEAKREELQLQEQITNKVQSILDSIESTMQNIKYSKLNITLPTPKAESAKQDLTDLFNKALAGGSAEIQDFLSFAPTALEQYQSAFKSSQTYEDFYNEVMGEGGMMAQIKELAKSKSFEAVLISEIKGGSSAIEDAIKSLQETIDALEPNYSEIEKQVNKWADDIEKLIKAITNLTDEMEAAARIQEYFTRIQEMEQDGVTEEEKQSIVGLLRSTQTLASQYGIYDVASLLANMQNLGYATGMTISQAEGFWTRYGMSTDWSNWSGMSDAIEAASKIQGYFTKINPLMTDDMSEDDIKKIKSLLQSVQSTASKFGIYNVEDLLANMQNFGYATGMTADQAKAYWDAVGLGTSWSSTGDTAGGAFGDENYSKSILILLGAIAQNTKETAFRLGASYTPLSGVAGLMPDEIKEWFLNLGAWPVTTGSGDWPGSTGGTGVQSSLIASLSIPTEGNEIKEHLRVAARIYDSGGYAIDSTHPLKVSITNWPTSFGFDPDLIVKLLSPTEGNVVREYSRVAARIYDSGGYNIDSTHPLAVVVTNASLTMTGFPSGFNVNNWPASLGSGIQSSLLLPLLSPTEGNTTREYARVAARIYDSGGYNIDSSHPLRTNFTNTSIGMTGFPSSMNVVITGINTTQGLTVIPNTAFGNSLAAITNHTAGTYKNLQALLILYGSAFYAIPTTGIRGYYSTDMQFHQASFAEGGIAEGPESGYMATLHGTELVVSPNATYPATVFNGGSTQEEGDIVVNLQVVTDMGEVKREEVIRIARNEADKVRIVANTHPGNERRRLYR